VIGGWLREPLACDAMPTFHDLEMRSITGEQIPFSTFRDQVVLVVNVASR
jgi:glutathione peroxidase-family protein